MSWFRNVAALAAGTAVVLTPHVLPASASTTHSAVVVAAPSKVASGPMIQGVVTDQFGNYVDDVEVRATRADGTPAASAQTYASRWPEGRQHGYCYLEVGKAGTYTLTLSKKGYETVEYEAVVTRKHKVVSLGEIAIEKIVASTTTNAMLTKKSVSNKEKASVVVAVTTNATKKPTGLVEVREGTNVVGTGELKPGNQGAVTVTLGRLGKGGHVLRAYFLGSDDLAPSSSKQPITLMVGKSRK